MPAMPISAASRYFNRGTSKVVFVTTLADPAAPSRIEIDAGTDLSNEVSSVEGWVVESTNIETPNLGTRFTGSIPGSTSAEDSSLSLYADEAGDDARTLLPRDTSGYILWMDGGDVAGRLLDVFPVRVGSVGKPRSTDDEAAVLEVSFFITAEPTENVVIPV